MRPPPRRHSQQEHQQQMSEPKQKDPESPSEPEEEIPAGEAENGDREPEAVAEDPPRGESERIAALEAEVGELKDQLLRAMAETENLRRRSQREREEAVRYAATALVRDLLPVADNLSRALASVPAEALEGASEGGEAMKTLLDGLKLTERELQSAFGRHHIVKLDPVGERLDPHRHEALFEVPPSISAYCGLQLREHRIPPSAAMASSPMMEGDRTLAAQ